MVKASTSNYAVRAVVGCMIVWALGGCAPKVGYVPATSSAYSPLAADAEVRVFFPGSAPDEPYEIIGMVSVDKKATTVFETVGDEEIVELLKKEARKRGGNALIDAKVIPDEDMPQRRKRGEAKVAILGG